MEKEAGYLGVARFRKPHGLKGEALVFPLTDDAEDVFVPGRTLVPVDDDGTQIGEPIVIHSARRHQRHWLLLFEGIIERATLEGWGQRILGAASDELRPPAQDEMYIHEIIGSRVMEDGVEIGVVTDLLGVPGGRVLVVERDGKEHLIPFGEPVVQRLNREKRTIEVVLPQGLLEI